MRESDEKCAGERPVRDAGHGTTPEHDTVNTVANAAHTRATRRHVQSGFIATGGTTQYALSNHETVSLRYIRRLLVNA